MKIFIIKTFLTLHFREWKHGFFDCLGFGCSNCLIGYCCPWCHACLASQSSDQGICMGILQCFFYPLLVPILRCQAREKKGIEVNF